MHAQPGQVHPAGADSLADQKARDVHVEPDGALDHATLTPQVRAEPLEQSLRLAAWRRQLGVGQDPEPMQIRDQRCQRLPRA